MKEIRFRAWDKNKKVMLYGVTVYGSGNGGIYIDEAIEAYGSEENLPDEQSGDWVFLMNHELTQLIGIKDKNEKEIYEGDIVCCWDDAANNNSWGLDKKHTGVVEYAQPGYILRVPGKIKVDTPAYKHWENDVCLQEWCNAENIEVIGNIYESPHLLNSNNNPDECDATEVK